MVRIARPSWLRLAATAKPHPMPNLPKPASGALRVWPWAFTGGVLGAVGAIFYWAPAAWLAAAVQHYSGGYVRLINPTGTVWNGSAVLILASGSDGRDALSLPSRLNWHTGVGVHGIYAEVAAPCCTVTPLRMRVQSSQLRVEGQQLQLPIELLKGLGTPWNTLGLQGTMDAQASNLAFRRTSQGWRMDGQVSMRMNHVSTRLSTLPDVGSYQLILAGGDSPTLRLQTLRGDLQLKGDGHWQGGKFVFRGEAQAAPASAAALNNLLTLLGDRQGGVTKIRLG